MLILLFNFLSLTTGNEVNNKCFKVLIITSRKGIAEDRCNSISLGNITGNDEMISQSKICRSGLYFTIHPPHDLTD